MVNIERLTFEELDHLVCTSDPHELPVDGNTLKCIPTVDICYTVERIKKGELSPIALQLIKARECSLLSAIHDDSLYAIDLDTLTLENGLFEISDDCYTVKLCDSVVDRLDAPELTSRLISLRAFDLLWGTDFCQLALEE